MVGTKKCKNKRVNFKELDIGKRPIFFRFFSSAPFPNFTSLFKNTPQLWQRCLYLFQKHSLCRMWPVGDMYEKGPMKITVVTLGQNPNFGRFFKAPLSSSFFSLGCIHPGVCCVAAKYFGIAPKWKKLPRTTLISGAQKFFPLIKRIFAGPQKARRLERVQSKAATSLVVQVSKSCNKQTINRSNQFQMTL